MARRTRQALPDDPKILKDRIRYLEAKLAKAEAELRGTRAERFAASSERNENQYRLFDEAEQEVESTVTEAETVEVAAHQKRRPKRYEVPPVSRTLC